MYRAKEEVVNPGMRSLIHHARDLGMASRKLDQGIAEYLADGIVVDEQGAVLSGRAVAGDLPSRDSLEDSTAFEALANKIYLHDWLSDSAEDHGLVFQVAQGLLLADLVGHQARSLGIEVTVILTCQMETGEAIFRFHRTRADEPPWMGDVEKMTEPILWRRY